MKERIEKRLKELREGFEELPEDFNPCDAAGGNFDDAFWMGHENGWTEGAMYELCKLLKDES